MGLFDHLFKTKPLSSEDKIVETGSGAVNPAKPVDAPAKSQPPHRADPSAFLHPKDFVRPSALIPASKSGAVSGVRPAERKPQASSSSTPPDEIVLTLGDVLSRIPTPYLKPGQHDAKRELRFKVNDLSSDIARGRAAVPLSRIAQLVPDIFVRSISRDEDTPIRLPLQKLVEQIGLLRSRPLSPPMDRNQRPGTQPATVPALPELKLEAVSLVEKVPVTLDQGPQTAGKPFELKPVAEEPPLGIPEESAAPVIMAGQDAELTGPPPVLLTAAIVEPVAQTVDTPSAPPPWQPLEGAPKEPETLEHVVEKMDADVQASQPSAPEMSEPVGKTELAPEPVAPLPAASPLPAAQEPVISVQPENLEVEADGEKIQLNLAAILRQCPQEIIVGVLPPVPDHIRIALPFAPIDRQLVHGHVEVSALRFVAALPSQYQRFFDAKVGVNVPIPLEEVFQNLPTTGTEPVFPTGVAAPLILAPAAAVVQPSPILASSTALPPVIEHSEVKTELPASHEIAPLAEVSAASEPTDMIPPENTASEKDAGDFAQPSETTGESPGIYQPSFHRFTPPPPPPIPAPVISQPSMIEPAVSAEKPMEPAVEHPSIFIPFVDAPQEMNVCAVPPMNPETIDLPISAMEEIPVPPVSDPVVDVSPIAPPAETPAEVEEPEAESAPELPSTPLEPTVMTSEGTQIIPPPQMFRPVILPPPIFGYTPPSEPAVFEELSVVGPSPATTEESQDDLSLDHVIEVDAEKVIPMSEVPAPTGSKTASFQESAPEFSAPTEENEAPLWQVIASDGHLVPGKKEDLEAVVSPAASAEPVDASEPTAALPSEAPAEPPLGAITFFPAEEMVAELPVLESTEPKADISPMPFLHLPTFTPESEADDILPPPALPLQRFDQDALQALFLTEEMLDLPKISRLAAQLPGVHACVIATRDQACTGGTLPDGFDLAALLGLAPRVGEAAGRLPIGALKHFTLYGEQYSVSFFERAGLSLCAVHRPRSFVPGVREKLVAIADELSKS